MNKIPWNLPILSTLLTTREIFRNSQKHWKNACFSTRKNLANTPILLGSVSISIFEEIKTFLLLLIFMYVRKNRPQIDYFIEKYHMKIIFNRNFGRRELFEIYWTICYSILAIGLLTKISFYRWKKNSKVRIVYLSIYLKY